MRWPFRRKDAGSTTEPAPSAAPAEVRGTGVPRPPARQWATLPAIPVTITRTAPLVAGPAPVLPPLRPGGRGGSAPAVAPALGRVTGLARPAAPAPEPVAPQPSAPVELVLPAPAVRRPARPMPVEVPTLTDAADEYVGEPREPAEPHRAPGFLRYAPTWLMPGEPMIPGLPAPTQSVPDEPVGPPPSFLPPELRSEPAPRPELPPRMAEVPRAEPALPQARKRRANLGQSRRLGLGAPITHAEGEPLVHPEEPPRVVEGVIERAPEPVPPPAPEPAPRQEPPPAPAAPPRSVTVEPPAPAPTPPADSTDDGPDDGGSPPPPAPPVRPTPPSTSPPERKRAVAAVYRATAELRPAPRRRDLPRATVVQAVPPDLANAVRTRQQADVSTVPVYRGPKVSEAAKTRGARAFASGGAVFLPDEAGPVDSGKARGLLAHELVHAVQQRTLGAMLPAPDSAHGQLLEAEAQAAERYYSGESGAAEPAPLIHAPMPAPPPAAERHEPDLAAAAQLATALANPPTPTAAPAQQPLHSPFDERTTAEVGKIAEHSAKQVVAEWTNPKLAGGGQAAPGAPGAGSANATGTPAGKSPTGTQPTATAPTFDRAARKQALVAQTLAGLNQDRYGDQLTELTPEQEEQVERMLDAEQGSAGGTVAQTGPPEQHYEKNSKEAWMHALTGANMNYGSGITGFREPVGSEKSWWGGETNDKRPLSDRLADGLGLASPEADTQFDTDTWYQDDSAATTPAAAGAGENPDAKPAHDDWKYGQANPDQSSFDVSRIDLDELSSRIYDRLRSRLRLELLVDRERAGLLTDFR